MSFKIVPAIIPFILDESEKFFNYENQSYLKLRRILKIIGTTDEMVTEKFIIIDCNKNKYKNIDDDKNESNDVYDKDCKLDIKQLINDLMSKIFDKSGDLIDTTRNMLIFENKKRYENNEGLIDTKKKVIDYLKNNGIKEEPKNIKNWIRYALGEKIFNKIKNNYYYSKDEIIKACKKIGINDFSDYKKKKNMDLKLVPYSYINDGFYYDLDPKFNLNILLKKHNILSFNI